MAHFGATFTELLDNSGMTKEEVAKKIGCQTSNIYKMQQKDSVDMALMEQVCRAFSVNPLIFFDDDVLKNEIPSFNKSIYQNKTIFGHCTMNIGIMEEVRHLKMQLDDKEKQLKEKERFIQYMLNGPEAAKGVDL